MDKNIRLSHCQLRTPNDVKKPSKIFVGSTIEMFHPEIPLIWRDHIFNVIEANPQHTFQILTKLPQNIDRPMPENVWLGTTITCSHDLDNLINLKRTKARIKFVSLEPYLVKFGAVCFPTTIRFDWLIMGRLTGHGNKYDPCYLHIREQVDEMRYRKIPIFMKDNLKEIWGEPLIQEFP